jgi:hypothetical protein
VIPAMGHPAHGKTMKKTDKTLFIILGLAAAYYFLIYKAPANTAQYGPAVPITPNPAKDLGK